MNMLKALMVPCWLSAFPEEPTGCGTAPREAAAALGNGSVLGLYEEGCGLGDPGWQELTLPWKDAQESPAGERAPSGAEASFWEQGSEVSSSCAYGNGAALQ